MLHDLKYLSWCRQWSQRGRAASPIWAPSCPPSWNCRLWRRRTPPSRTTRRTARTQLETSSMWVFTAPACPLSDTEGLFTQDFSQHLEGWGSTTTAIKGCTKYRSRAETPDPFINCRFCCWNIILLHQFVSPFGSDERALVKLKLEFPPHYKPKSTLSGL